MTSKQRVQTVLRGGTPDRVPVCLHNFLPAAAEAGIRLEDYLSDPECAARAHLEAMEKYGHDCTLIDLDTTMLAEAMGAGRDAAPNAPGHIAGPAVTDLADLDGIRVIDPHKDGRIPVLLEAVRIMAAKAGDRVAIRANADQCAFSLAALLRGMEDFFMDLMDEEEHEHARQLLELCYQSHLAVHRALKEAGADFTSLGDSSSGPDVVSPAMFEAFARPYQERLVRDLSADGIFTVIHICGNTSALLDRFVEYPFCGFELDYKTDAARAKASAGHRACAFRKHRSERRDRPRHTRRNPQCLPRADRVVETPRALCSQLGMRDPPGHAAGKYPCPGGVRAGIRRLLNFHARHRVSVSFHAGTT
jgi:uroporphyrinogen decarboxylase